MAFSKKEKIIKEIVDKLCENGSPGKIADPLSTKIIEKNISENYEEPPLWVFDNLKFKIRNLQKPGKGKKGNYFYSFFQQYKIVVRFAFACIMAASVVYFYKIKPDTSSFITKRIVQFQNNLNYQLFNHQERLKGAGFELKFPKQSRISLKKDNEYSVVLHSGQVNFIIDHLTIKKKFFVIFQGYLVQSLGTKFIISLDEKIHNIKLTEGSIRVFPIAKGLVKTYNAPKEIILRKSNEPVPHKKAQLDKYIKAVKNKYTILIENRFQSEEKTLLKKRINNDSVKPTKFELRFQIHIGKESIFYLKNGDRITGKIFRVEKKWIYIQSSRGLLKVPKNDIKKFHIPEK